MFAIQKQWIHQCYIQVYFILIKLFWDYLGNSFYSMIDYSTTLIANNVQILNKEVDFLFTSEDVKKIKKFANQKQGVTYLFIASKFFNKP